MPAPLAAALGVADRFTIDQLRIVPVPSLDDTAPQPDHSEVRKVAEAVLGGLKYSFASVAAGTDVEASVGTVEHEMHLALETLRPERRAHFAGTAAPLLRAAPEVRTAVFGPVGEVDAADFLRAGGLDSLATLTTMPVLDAKLFGVRVPSVDVALTELEVRGDDLVVPGGAARREAVLRRTEVAGQNGLEDPERTARIWGPRVAGDPFAGGVVDGEFVPFATTDKLGLWITQVRCVDETNPEFWGSDEIALAGVEVDEDGDTRPIGETFIGGGFDDGDARGYPDWRYTWFNLHEGQHWPKRYSVSFILAEKDHGGLQSFLDRIWQQVRDRVKAAIAQAVGSVASAYLGPVIGQAIGQAVAWVVDVFVQWIIHLFGDDLFPVKTVSVTTPSAAARWYYPDGSWGNPSSGVRVAHFYGHGGHYEVHYRWMFHS